MNVSDEAIQATHDTIEPHVSFKLADVPTLELAENALAAGLKIALRDKLDEMQLFDDTGDPQDIGYQLAIDELRAWIDEED